MQTRKSTKTFTPEENSSYSKRKLPVQGAMQCWRKAVNEGEHWIKPVMHRPSELSAAWEQNEDDVLLAEMPLTEVNVLSVRQHIRPESYSLKCR